MDLRRASRAVIDPKFRQVGFITPGGGAPAVPDRSQSAPPDAVAHSPPNPDLSLSGSSLSPVMILPPRHASADLAAVVRPSDPLPVPNPKPTTDIHVGSYNPSEPLLATPPMTSPSNRADANSELSEDVSWIGRGGGRAVKVVASSFPAGGGATPKSSFTTASVLKTLPGVSETSNGAVIDMQNEGVGISKPQKQKTSKAERRAVQEAQRAAKAAAKEAGMVNPNIKHTKLVKPSSPRKDGPQGFVPVASSEKKIVDRLPEKDRKKDVPHPRMQFDDIHRVEKAKRRAIVSQFEARNRVELFRHLPQYVHGTQLPDLESKFFQLEPMHPSVYKVGLQYLSGNISGGNARCIAMLLAFQEAIKDYSVPPRKALVRDLTAKISSYVSFLIECRPLSISMGNAIRFLKNRIAKLPHTLSESEAKSCLQSDIDRFIAEKIVLADKVIVRHAVTKIRDGDVLLTYASSSVVEMILTYAHELGKKFRVVVVDSRPKLEGQVLLHRLVAKGLDCTYTHINAISYIMCEVTRVFLGASSVLSNGAVYSRVGTASVAMVAHAFQVPVLICCEAYKFHERVQLDSICSNELGDPDVIAKVPGRKDLNHLDDWADSDNLQLLNLTYDATPSDYVSMIITDYGMIPPTSVPVIVREYRREHLWI
ncbi:uncharacterized protein [Typha latifolia]|uniref:uncharacterized protein n=1 Tax=Typha latifolia TaxID=4733 RepID=UPI003C2CCFE6